MLSRTLLVLVIVLLGRAPCASFAQSTIRSTSTSRKPSSTSKSTVPRTTFGALKRKTSYEFRARSLQDVFEQVSQKHDIPIFLDKRSLDAEGIPSDSAVNYQAAAASLGDVLDGILDPFKLTWLTRCDVLFITTKKTASPLLEARAYKLLVLPVKSTLKTDKSMYQMLEEIEPESWESSGGRGSIAVLRSLSHSPLVPNSVVVVRQSQSVHRKIGAAFNDIMEPVLRGDRDEIVDSLGMGLPKALNEWTNLSFDQRPLRDVVAEIQQSHAVKIVIDARALAKENRFDTQQITWKPKAVRLSSMLTLLLSQHGLDWTVDRSGITVTTPGAIQRQMFTASYPAKELFKFQTGNVSKAVNLTAISNLFSTSVSPGTWQEVGGPGAIRQGTKDTLEIRQNFWAHQEIARLLEDLRIAIQSMKF